MTVQDLRKLLSSGEYPGSMHVCSTSADFVKGRVEIRDLWVDSHGVLNIITGPSCNEIDTELKKEYGLK